MRVQGSALRLTIVVDGADLWHHKPLYVEIIHRAHRHGMAGATAIRGMEGFTATSQIHTAGLFALTNHVPVTIIIVDGREKIETFLDALDGVFSKGVVLLEDVEVIRYVPRQPAARGT